MKMLENMMNGEKRPKVRRWAEVYKLRRFTDVLCRPVGWLANLGVGGFLS